MILLIRIEGQCRRWAQSVLSTATQYRHPIRSFRWHVAVLTSLQLSCRHLLCDSQIQDLRNEWFFPVTFVPTLSTGTTRLRLSPLLVRNVPPSTTTVLPWGHVAQSSLSLFRGLSWWWPFAGGQHFCLQFRLDYLCCFVTPKHQVCEVCVFPQL